MIPFYPNVKDADVRVHGNGFIQAELGDGSKLHIWSNGCPCQEEPTLIHNHTSPFTSHILHGVLINEEYSLRPSIYAPKGDPLYRMYEAVGRKKKDTGLQATKQLMFLATSRRFHLSKGSTYEFPGTEQLFHMTMPASDLVVTRVLRHREVGPDRNPMVLVPDGKEPDNKFDRYQHTDYGIEIYLKVEDMLRGDDGSF